MPTVTCLSDPAQGSVRTFSQTTINNLKARLCATTSTASCPDVSGSICVLSSDPDGNGVYVRWTRSGGIDEASKPWPNCFAGTKAIVDQCFQDEGRIGGSWTEGGEHYELAVLKAEDIAPVPSSTGKYQPGTSIPSDDDNTQSTATTASDVASTTITDTDDTVETTIIATETDTETNIPTSTSTQESTTTRSTTPTQITSREIIIQQTSMITTATEGGTTFTYTYIYTLTNTQDHVIDQPTNTSIDPSTESDSSGNKSTGLSPGTSAGVAVGATLLLVLGLLGIWFFYRRRRRQQALRQYDTPSASEALPFNPDDGPLYPPGELGAHALAELSTTTIHRAELETEAQKGDVGVHVGGKPPEQAPFRMMRGGQVYTPRELEGCIAPIVGGLGELPADGPVAELEGNSEMENVRRSMKMSISEEGGKVGNSKRGR